METITSSTNKTVQYIKSLKNKQTRKEEKKFVVEGFNLVCDIPKNVTVELIVVAEERMEKCLPIAHKFCAEIKIFSERIFDSICETKTPSGILAVVSEGWQVLANENQIAVFDAISDAGNFGTMVRTCVALGVTEIIAIACVDHFSGKVVRASMGGIFNVNIHALEMKEAKELLKNYTVFSLDMSGENLFCEKLQKSNIALVVGSEAHGVSDEIKAMSKKTLSLPMSKNIESLNAAVAFSVAMYNILN